MEPVDIEYTDGTKVTVEVPSDEEISDLDTFHNEMMNRFFPNGIPLAED